MQIFLDMVSSGYVPGNNTSQALNGSVVPVGGGYTQSLLFMPPWGFPPGYPYNHAANVAARNAMLFIYPSYHQLGLQHTMHGNLQPTMDVNNSGNSCVPSRTIPVSSSGTGGLSSSSGSTSAGVGAACVSAMRGTSVSNGTPALISQNGTTTTSTPASEKNCTPMSQFRDEFDEAIPKSGRGYLTSREVEDNVQKASEVENVKSRVTSLLEWMATVDKQLDSIKKKLDLILEIYAPVIRARRGKENVSFNPETPLVSSEPSAAAFGSFNDPVLKEGRKRDVQSEGPSVPFKKPRPSNDTGTNMETDGGGRTDSAEKKIATECEETGTGRAKRKTNKPSRYLQ